MQENLALRDIHLPEPVSWWPLAPGWWLLLIGIPALLALLIWLWRRWRRMTVKKLALRELESIARENLDNRTRVRSVSIWLRRVCLSVYPRENTAGLIGAEWLAFLDGPLGDRRFSEGPGRLLLEGPYRREPDGDSNELIALCREWIKHLPPSEKAKEKHKP